MSVTEGAQIFASTFGQGNAGSVNVRHRTVTFKDSGAFSIVNEEAVGNAGDINIQTGSLSVTEGAQLISSTFGQGNAGSINVRATETVSFDDSETFSIVEPGAVGNVGDVNIHTGNLWVTEGTRISASMRGQRNAGSVNVTATDTVSFDGESSGAFSTVNEGAVGEKGDVNIHTGNLWVTEGAQISASTFGQGNAGSVNVTATDTVSFDGEDSGAFSNVNEGAVGVGGDVNVQTRSLWVTEGARISASTFGQGNAGRVNVTATDTVSFDGESSGAFSNVNEGAVGDGGEIQISSREISVTNGAQLQTLVSEAENNLPSGRGNAGNVNLIATEMVFFEGEGNNGLPSAVVSAVEAGAVGNGGNIDIQTGSLFLTEGAGISASMGGQGNAGNVNVTATDMVSFNGSRTFSDLEAGAVGKGGDIFIQTGSLFVTEGAQISASTGGQGNAGSVNVTATDTVSFDGERNGSPVEPLVEYKRERWGSEGMLTSKREVYRSLKALKFLRA